MSEQNHERPSRHRHMLGVATLSNGFRDRDGRWFSSIYGYLRVVTDKEWGDDFRSTEHWQLMVFSDEYAEHPVAVFPGCRVNALIGQRIGSSGIEIFDATNAPGIPFAAMSNNQRHARSTMAGRESSTA